MTDNCSMMEHDKESWAPLSSVVCIDICREVESMLRSSVQLHSNEQNAFLNQILLEPCF